MLSLLQEEMSQWALMRWRRKRINVWKKEVFNKRVSNIKHYL
jgi:hypothetical protein